MFPRQKSYVLPRAEAVAETAQMATIWTKDMGADPRGVQDGFKNSGVRVCK